MDDAGAVRAGGVEPITFRAATPADVRAVVSLIQSAYRGEEALRGWTTEAELVDGQRTTTEEVAGIVTRNGGRVLLAEQGGTMIACCRLERRPDATVYLGMLAVRPERQSGGVGRAVMQEAERVARDEWGARRMQMQVISIRHELIAWYRRLGYEDTGETQPFPYDDPTDVPRRPGLEFVMLTKTLT